MINKYTKKAFVATLIFIVYTLLVAFVDVKAIGPCNTEVGFASINGWFHSATNTSNVLYSISNYAGYISLLSVGIFAIVGIYELVKCKSFKKLDPRLYILAGFYVFLAFFYLLFEKIVINYRPVLMTGEITPEASYPSSHTMLVIGVMFTAVHQISYLLKNNARLRSILIICCYFLTVLTIVTRLLSGVHWLTDIIGGALLSFTLVLYYYAVVDFSDSKHADK